MGNMRTSSFLFAAGISVTSSLPASELERLQEWNDEVYGGTVNIVEDEVSKGSSCIWLQGNYGQALICPAYYAAAGVCGSGRRADCNGHYFELFCCDVQDVQTNCRNQGVKYGTEDQCPEGKIIAGDAVRVDQQIAKTRALLNGPKLYVAITTSFLWTTLINSTKEPNMVLELFAHRTMS